MMLFEYKKLPYKACWYIMQPFWTDAQNQILKKEVTN